jgi:hypothetical protein
MVAHRIIFVFFMVLYEIICYDFQRALPFSSQERPPFSRAVAVCLTQLVADSPSTRPVDRRVLTDHETSRNELQTSLL